jgi:hypothetical protein
MVIQTVYSGATQAPLPYLWQKIIKTYKILIKAFILIVFQNVKLIATEHTLFQVLRSEVLNL